MSGNDLLKELIVEYQQILAHLKQNREAKFSGELPKDFEERLQRLEEIVKVFEQITKAITGEVDLQQELDQVAKIIENIPFKYKRPLIDVTKLKRELELERVRIERVIKMYRGELPKPKGPPPEREKLKEKKEKGRMKSKSSHQKKGWKKL